MNRLLLLVLATVCALLAGASPASAAPKNIILILTDDQDQSAETISKMPYLHSRTPEGGGGWYRFDNAFINNATCCPSRATILSGQWSHHTGVEVTSGAPMFDDSSTIATTLDAAGYRTCFDGKYHLGANGPVPQGYVPPGWDHFVEQDPAQASAYYNFTLYEDGVATQFGSDPADYSVDVLREKALECIDAAAAGEDPFFLMFAPRAPHNGWTAAPRYLGHYSNEPVSLPPSWNEDTSDKPGWWANRPVASAGNRIGAMRKEWDTLLAVDDAVKAIHKRVQDLDLMPNTVILYMTDNGYSFGEHRWSKKRCVYDSCSRTPLYVKYGGASQGTVFSSLVGNEDLAPTFADLAEVAPAISDGHSIEPMLATRTEPPGWESEVLLRSRNPSNEVGHPPDAWGIRTPTRLYAETTGTGEVELYDLTVDPWQLENVADDPDYLADRVELAARLLALRTRPAQ